MSDEYVSGTRQPCVCHSISQLTAPPRPLFLPVLLHEPDNPEARQFLPLIQEKLLEGINTPTYPLFTTPIPHVGKQTISCTSFPLIEHEMERSTEEEDDDNDSGSDEESSSSSSSSPSEEEEEG